MVIDIDITLLRHSKHHLVVQVSEGVREGGREGEEREGEREREGIESRREGIERRREGIERRREGRMEFPQRGKPHSLDIPDCLLDVQFAA